jgi:transposase-like protein
MDERQILVYWNPGYGELSGLAVKFGATPQVLQKWVKAARQNRPLPERAVAFARWLQNRARTEASVEAVLAQVDVVEPVDRETLVLRLQERGFCRDVIEVALEKLPHYRDFRGKEYYYVQIRD